MKRTIKKNFFLNFLLKPKVTRGAEILEVLHSLPQVKNFLFSLYECRYADFFKSLGKSISFNLKKNEISKLNTLFISLCWTIHENGSLFSSTLQILH